MIRCDLIQRKTLSGCWQRRRSKSKEDMQWWSVWYFVLATGLRITIAVRSFAAGRICTALVSNFSWVSLHNSGDEKVNDLQGRKKKKKETERENKRLVWCRGVSASQALTGRDALIFWLAFIEGDSFRLWTSHKYDVTRLSGCCWHFSVLTCRKKSKEELSGVQWCARMSMRSVALLPSLRLLTADQVWKPIHCISPFLLSLMHFHCTGSQLETNKNPCQ